MTTSDIQHLANTVTYCLNHCDSDDETKMVEWVTEHLLNNIHRNQPRLNVQPLVRLIPQRVF